MTGPMLNDAAESAGSNEAHRIKCLKGYFANAMPIMRMKHFSNGQSSRTIEDLQYPSIRYSIVKGEYAQLPYDQVFDQSSPLKAY